MRKSLFLAGLLVLGTGFYIVLLAIGIVPAVGGQRPHWILSLAGMAFVIGGGLVSIGELINHDDASGLRDFELARAFRHVMIALLLIIFAVLGNWVAFGPGARPTSVVLGLPFSDSTISSNEWMGRFGFGAGAITLDLLLLVLIYAMLKRWWRRNAKDEP